MERRLEDRIRELCARFVAEEDPTEYQALAAELRTALSEHVNRLRTKFADSTVVHERRDKNG